MRVCFYHELFPMPFNWNSISETPVGGTQSALIYMAHLLQASGIEVTICNKSQTTEINGVKYTSILGYEAFIRFENSQNFDVVVYVGPEKEFAEKYALQIKAKKKIMWAQNDWHHHSAYENYDAIVCVSNSQRLSYAYLPIFRKICFIHNSVDLEKFPNSLLTSNKSEYAIFVGAVTESKGLHHIVRAWSNIKNLAPSAQLLIAGSATLYGIETLGDLKVATTEYENNFLKPYILTETGQIRDDIHFLGAVPHSELGQMIAGCRVALVNPNWKTSTETCCNAALEAQASGTPVVGVNQGSLPEVIINGVTGKIVKYPSDALYAQTVAALLTNHETSEHLGRAAREFIVNNFSGKVQAEKWLKLLGAIVSNQSLPSEVTKNWYSEAASTSNIKWIARKSRLGLVARHSLDFYRKIN